MRVGSKKRIAVFIDWVLPKNKVQIDAMHDLGYSVSVFVNKYNSATLHYFRKDDEYVVLKDGFFSRFIMIVRFFAKNYSVLHHSEIYPGGRFSFIYVLISRYFGIPPVCVERGDLLYYKKDGYPLLTRVSMWICYKMSEIVWYREPYMQALLEKIKVKSIFFLHNAVDSQNVIFRPDAMCERDIDFLWVNRITPERRSEWFVDILRGEEFKDTSSLLAGLLENSANPEMQEHIKRNAPDNLSTVKFVSNPAEFYCKAKFFVLPADVVFANNALLEAMSHGVIPLIARQSGSELLVEDGVSGFIFDYNEESFRNTMLRALELSQIEFTSMSLAAKERINLNFSSETFRGRLFELYKKIDS